MTTLNAFAETQIRIAYSANISGYLEPCGCAGPDEEMLGGLQKRVTVIKEYQKEKGPALVVDAGDLFFGKSSFKESLIPSVQIKADAIATVLTQTGIHAINVGELDLALGIDFIKELEDRHNLPFVSANLLDVTGKRLFSPYVIVEIDGVKVGIFGVMGDTKKLKDALKTRAGQEIQVQDTLESAKEMVSELRDQVDFLVALTHQHMGRNWVIARRTPGIDLIVGGHHRQKLKVPYRDEETFIVQSGEKGYHQGLVEITIKGNERSADNQLIALGDAVMKDGPSERVIKKYNDDITALYVKAAKRQQGDGERRAKQCEECHEGEYQTWEASAHAHAFETLEKKSRQFDPDCVACHTSLFEKLGGYSMSDQLVSMRDVQCEVCHGDGQAHSADDSLPLPIKASKEACFDCHTTERSPGFKEDLDHKWSEIAH